MAFPSTLPSYTITSGSETPNSAAGGTGLSGLLNAFEVDVTALGTKVGTGATAPAANTLLYGTGAGTSAWQGLTSAQLISIVSDETGSGSLVFANTPTIVTPTIASFTNAQHNHTNAAGGGKITSAAITSFDTSLTTISNPYKFRAYRNAAANTGNGAFAVVAYDTENFDTNNNLSAGVYTAPVTGYYQFNAQLIAVTGAAEIVISFFKNGVEYSRGGDGNYGSGTNGITISDLIQLTAADTVDVRAFGTAAKALLVGSTATNWFSGFLVSQT